MYVSLDFDEACYICCFRSQNRSFVIVFSKPLTSHFRNSNRSSTYTGQSGVIVRQPDTRIIRPVLDQYSELPATQLAIMTKYTV